MSNLGLESTLRELLSEKEKLIIQLQKQLEAKEIELDARVNAAELGVRKEMQDQWKEAFELGFEKCKSQLTFAKSLLSSGMGASL